MLDVIEGEEEEESDNEVEEGGALPPMDCDMLNLESGICGNKEDGRPVKRAEADVAVAAGMGFVGDGVSAPDDFWLPSTPLPCEL